MTILYVAVTNHGFGHATRAASVVAEIKRLCPEIGVVMVTTAPHWLLSAYIPDPFIHRPRALDVGVIQSDSFKMDQAATLEKLRHIRQQQATIVAGEVTFIQQNRVRLILADIPPLAAPIARAAGIPCWMMSNFGWDFIYRPWGGEFLEIADWIGDCFQQCDRLFRLPFHEPMAAFPVITEVGLTGGSPRYDLATLRTDFGLRHPPERTLLMTFGGLGLEQIPYQNLDHFPDWQFITFDRQAPDRPNLLKVLDNQYRPVDFMPLSGRVLSKPGFSTFAEACRLDLPIITLTREGFAESPLLLTGIQAQVPHRILQPQEFFQGDWAFLRQPLNSPQTFGSVPKDGNETIARSVVEYLNP
ncbi:glycosyl transferase [Leptolyngbya sp. 'hensonii']|uniref:glycosyl transferase n=1 Tax=Leptolyngbya sp. 'hensonii' TaxID=1922337 RepID=UPI0009500604|nr:glycosyl transferase [Leptolyngbya sp. 'hensonii']OLP17086.1 glycosyl transferase [Leptolyngbya sp. 'hensonii']